MYLRSPQGNQTTGEKSVMNSRQTLQVQSEVVWIFANKRIARPIRMGQGEWVNFFSSWKRELFPACAFFLWKPRSQSQNELVNYFTVVNVLLSNFAVLSWETLK